jgi:ribonuclease P protein subunit RPR2
MPKKFTRNASENKKIARERVNELFKQAEKAKEKVFANRYVELARKIAMRYKIRIPTELKRRVCKHCYSYLRPGKNVRIRTKEGKVVYYCLECKKYMRFTTLIR